MANFFSRKTDVNQNADLRWVWPTELTGALETGCQGSLWGRAALTLAVMTHHQRAEAFIGILGERAVYAFNCNHLSVGSVSIIVHLEEPCSGIERKGPLPLSASVIWIIIRWDKGRRLHTSAPKFSFSFQFQQNKILKEESLCDSFPSESSIFLLQRGSSHWCCHQSPRKVH